VKHAKLLAWGGLLSSALLAAGFPRSAGLLMLFANMLCLVLPSSKNLAQTEEGENPRTKEAYERAHTTDTTRH
jgi:hypothetical protein